MGTGTVEILDDDGAAVGFEGYAVVGIDDGGVLKGDVRGEVGVPAIFGY